MDSGKPKSGEIGDALSDNIEHGLLPIQNAFCRHAMLVRNPAEGIVCNTKDDESMAKVD